jgi:hypothetical protein
VCFNFFSIEPRLHRLDYVHLLLRQECEDMEGFGFEYHYHWIWLFHLRTNAYNNFSVFEESSNAKEQRILSHHHEPFGDAIFVKFALHHWRSIEQKCYKMRDNSFDLTLLESHDKRLVLRVHIHNL